MDLPQKAKEYAFLLLKFRPRSEKEIYERLKRKKFSETVIKETISFLRQRSFIDDDYFARAWIESRLKRSLGLRRIRQELKLKGIAKELIDNHAEELKKDYPERDIVLKLAVERFGRLKALQPQKAKRRIYSYLLRRGFSPDIITDIVSRL